jgi:hypothetical protein
MGNTNTKSWFSSTRSKRLGILYAISNLLLMIYKHHQTQLWTQYVTFHTRDVNLAKIVLVKYRSIFISLTGSLQSHRSSTSLCINHSTNLDLVFSEKNYILKSWHIWQLFVPLKNVFLSSNFHNKMYTFHNDDLFKLYKPKNLWNYGFLYYIRFFNTYVIIFWFSMTKNQKKWQVLMYNI